MISSKELRQKDLEITQNGYNIAEVDALMAESAATIDAYEKQSGDLYHKLEVLAGKIEEYRQEEDAIKTALVTAQKMADKITKESNETASLLISKSEETAKDTVANAKAESDKIISSAREYSTNLIAEKTQQAEEITNKAQDKANEVIASAKVVAQDILDQAKQISDDLIAKSKAEKEAYEILSNTIKNDAKEFIEKVKSLYNNELDALNSAKLDKENDDTESEEKSIAEIDSEVSGLVDEIEEFTSSIPQPISSEESDDDTEDAEAEEAEDLQEVIAPDDAEDSEEEIEYEREEDNKEPAFDLNEIEYEEITDDDDEDDITEDDEKPVIEEDDEPADPMEAVEAFSQNQITPIKSDSPIPEISEDADMEDDDDLFDNSGELPFEAYFNVNQQDVHNDKSQTISLIPPEGDEDDEPQPKFKGIFKKKK
ncbi:DivIVA domain-containing protein [Eubacterium sp.]|uniref:DivIVA domain-containing protein n=1 Tax=Eubacterium sp. TaxID=142586 RepID=UPI0025BD2BCC|nr:DivIVA domain-containing protein [Eubacterium sp.]MCI7801712.1 DivIVA domain-containing protein [Eubacterium sp.]MDY3811601.1 DivIVA domain-containing protein [Eubacterium sp.]